MSVHDLIILGCSSQQPTRLRNHGAYLFRWNNNGLLFDPGEGTQRQFIFANVAPTIVNRIFVSHFHGDHCLGLGSMLMRLNLDKVTHPIHCYYPASGKKYFDRLRFGTIYHENINVIEHPVSEEGLVHDDGSFRIEAEFLNHSVENIAWRVTEADTRKFDKKSLDSCGVFGTDIRKLKEEGTLEVNGKEVSLDDVSRIRTGDSLAVVIDTLPCPEALKIARGAKTLLCESTYLDRHKDLAKKHFHMTAKQAAELAVKAGVKLLVLTHYSARYTDLKEFEDEARAIFPNTEVADDFKYIQLPKNTS
jgi:ribonuclease Z